MGSNVFTFKSVKINQIREMLSEEINESVINQVMIIIGSRCKAYDVISVNDLRELLSDDLSLNDISKVMKEIKSYNN